MEMEQVAVLYRLDRLIYVEKCDVSRGPCERDPPGPSGYIDQPGVLQLRKDLPDDHGVRIDTGSEEIAGHFIFFFKCIHTGEDVERNGKSAGNLHLFLSPALM